MSSESDDFKTYRTHSSLHPFSKEKEELQPGAHRKTSSQRKERREIGREVGVSRVRGVVSMKPRGTVLCHKPCQGYGSVCDGLYGAGHGARPAVLWSAQFLDFFRSAWVFLVRLKMLLICF